MASIELDVRNMSCGSCVATITRALQTVEGVTSVAADLRTGRVRVAVADAAPWHTGMTTALVAALDSAGYPATPVSGNTSAPTTSATAPHCADAKAQGHSGGSKGCCCGH